MNRSNFVSGLTADRRGGLVGRVAGFGFSKTAGGFLQLWGGLGNHFPPNQQLNDSGDFLLKMMTFAWTRSSSFFLRGRVVENQIFVAVFGVFLVGNLYQKCRG